MTMCWWKFFFTAFIAIAPFAYYYVTIEKDAHSEIGPDKEDIKKYISYLGWYGKVLLKKWSVTQNLTFRLQLEHGIRYFDLRVAARKDMDRIYFLHSFYGLPVEVGINEIIEFMNVHPREVILLDFNHFYEMDEHYHKKLTEFITEKFGAKMCRNLDMNSVTLEMLWKSNLQVIVFYQNDVIKNNIMFWPSTTIKAPWGNTEYVPVVIEFLEKEYQSTRTPSIFHVTQGVVTPTISIVIVYFYGSLQSVFGEIVAQSVVRWLKEKKAGPNGINICMIDFVEKADFIPTVLRLNR